MYLRSALNYFKNH